MNKTNDNEDWLDKLYNLPENPQKPQSVDEKWIDELFDQPENYQVLANGEIQYGYHGKPQTLKEELKYRWHEFKVAIRMLWQVKNPFDEHRPVLILWLHAIRPDLYAIAFPFRYYGDLFIGMLSRERRKGAYEAFQESTLYAFLFEMITLIPLALIALGIVLPIYWGLKALGLIG